MNVQPAFHDLEVSRRRSARKLAEKQPPPDAVMRKLVDAYPNGRELRAYIVAQYGLVPKWAEPYVAAARSKGRKGRRQEARVLRRKADNYRGNITKAKRAAIYERDGHTCVRCGTTRNLSLDHIIPVAQGGTNARSNLQTMCQPCNGAKGARMPKPEPSRRDFTASHLVARGVRVAA